MNTTMSIPQITPKQWAKTVDTLDGWRRYSKKRNAKSLANTIARNQKESRQGRTPLPPIGEQRGPGRTGEYEGRNYVDPDILDFVTIETWLAHNGEQGFRGYLRHKPRSRCLIPNIWHQHAGRFGDDLAKLVLDLNVGPKH